MPGAQGRGWGMGTQCLIRTEFQFVVVLLLSPVQLFVTPWTAASQARLSFTISWSLLKLMTIELMMPSNISSSAATFSCPQFFPASGSFPISRLFISGGQSIEVSASTSVLPMNIQGWFPLGLTSSPFSPRDSQKSSSAHQFQSINSSVLSLLYGPTLTSVQLLEKP